jgi:hypothetical protein
MKTLREYIDQLDEISRRDFLKGAGATAGLAAIGEPAKAQATESLRLEIDDLKKVSAALTVVEFAKEDGAFDVLKPIEVEITRLSKIMPEYMARLFAVHKLQMDRQGTSNRTRPITMSQGVKDLILDLQQITKKYEIKHAQMIREEEVDEAATPDAVARIEELIKYK